MKNIYLAYWMNKETRSRFHGFVIAKTRNNAYDIVNANLQKNCVVTHVYKANMHDITPQALTINFANMSSYFTDENKYYHKYLQDILQEV